MSEELNFDTDGFAPVEIPVKYEGVRYVLREASAEVARQYRNAATNGMRIGGGVGMELSHIGDCQPILVGGCLFVAGQEHPVGEDAIRRWPDRIVRPLFEKARSISKLENLFGAIEGEPSTNGDADPEERALEQEEAAREAAKKPPSDSTPGSP